MGRAEVDIHHHQARRVRLQGALEALQDPILGAAVALVAVAARVDLAGVPGEWLDSFR